MFLYKIPLNPPFEGGSSDSLLFIKEGKGEVFPVFFIRQSENTRRAPVYSGPVGFRSLRKRIVLPSP